MNHWLQFDLLTGSQLGDFWFYGDTPDFAAASESYFAVSASNYMLGTESVRSIGLGRSSQMAQADWGYIDPRFGLYGNTAAFIKRNLFGEGNGEYDVSLTDLSNGSYQKLCQYPTGITAYGIQIGDQYVTWFDNAVPEPSGLLALASLLGSAGMLLRKRRS